MDRVSFVASANEISNFSNNHGDAMVVAMEIPKQPNNTQALSTIKMYFMTEIANLIDADLLNNTVYLMVYETAEQNNRFDVQIWLDGEIATQKEYDLIEDFDKFDLHMFITANLMAHKQFGNEDDDFEDDDEEEEEEEEEEDLEDEEEEEEEEEEKPTLNDPNYNEDEDADYQQIDEEDDDLEEFVDEDEEEEEEDLDEIGEVTSGAVFSAEDIQHLWSDIFHQQMQKNTLHFGTFRNAIAPVVRALLFKSNPIMKAMSDLSDPPAPDMEDVEEIVNEIVEAMNQNTLPKQISLEQETIDKAQLVLKLKQQKKDALQANSSSTWTDDADYSTQLEKEIEEISKQFSENEQDWPILGADLQFLQIGEFHISRLYKGQFRCKYDSISQSLVYHMFPYFIAANTKEFETIAKRINTKEELFSYIHSQVGAFFKTKQYKMVLPQDSIQSICYHVSVVDPGLCYMVVELLHSPKFYEKVVMDQEWKVRNDFTAKKQALQSSKHVLVAAHEEMRNIVAMMQSQFPNKFSMQGEAFQGTEALQKQTPVISIVSLSEDLPSDEPFSDLINLASTAQTTETGSSQQKECCIQ